MNKIKTNKVSERALLVFNLILCLCSIFTISNLNQMTTVFYFIFCFFSLSFSLDLYNFIHKEEYRSNAYLYSRIISLCASLIVYELSIYAYGVSNNLNFVFFIIMNVSFIMFLPIYTRKNYIKYVKAIPHLIESHKFSLEKYYYNLNVSFSTGKCRSHVKKEWNISFASMIGFSIIIGIINKSNPFLIKYIFHFMSFSILPLIGVFLSQMILDVFFFNYINKRFFSHDVTN